MKISAHALLFFFLVGAVFAMEEEFRTLAEDDDFCK